MTKRRFVTPFSEPLCPLPLHPAEGDEFSCPERLCGAKYVAHATQVSDRPIWDCVENPGACPHPADECEPAKGNAAIGVHTVANAWACHACGNWVVPADELVLLV